MESEIFFFVFLVLFVASLQDFKRREIDVWLNLFIFFCGFSYLIFKSLIYNEISFLVNFSFLLVFVFIFVHLIYYGKVFSGGDCSLLFCLTPFFVSINFLDSFKNFFFFLVLLFVLGSFYGFFWSFSLLVKNFNKIKKSFFSRKNLFALFLFFVLFIFGFFVRPFFLFSFFFLILFFSYLFLKFEKELFVKEVYTKDLREGDWPEKDLIINGRVIKSVFDGLTKEEISFLRKHREKIRIKDGIPYAFAFYLAWIAFYFLDFIKEFLVLIVGV